MDLNSPSSSSSSLSPAPLLQSKRKSTRKITSCNPCRLSKLRCDGQNPCSTCVKKKASQGCIYRDSEIRKAAALAKKKEKNENKELRSEVDRLQKLVNVLVDARLETITSPPTSSVSPRSPRSSISVPPVPECVLPPSNEQDLAEKSFNLTISSFSTDSTSNSPSKELPTRRVELIDEVEKLLEGIPAKLRPTQISPPSFPSLRQSAPSLGQIMARLPLPQDVQLSEKSYWSCTSWFFHPIPEYVYCQHRQAVYSAHSKNEIADPVSLSIVLAVLGIGMHCRFTYTKTGGSQEELKTARNLIELSAAALSHSNFLVEPTVDGDLLAIFHLSIGPGDEGTLGFALTGLAVQSSFQMKLHRDPSQLGTSFTFREAEERRSLIHHIYLLDGICTASYSRGYVLLHARDITAAFPLDLHDHELEFAQAPHNRPFEETLPSERSTDVDLISLFLASGTPLSFEGILELDRELEGLISSINPLYQWNHLPFLDLTVAANELRAWRISIVWITIWREKLRLHRSFIQRSYSDPSLAYSRQACIDAAKGFIVIHACPANLIPAAGFTHKACLACIILALEVVFNKDQPASSEYRHLIEGALTRLEKFAKISIIARRGVKIVRYLLEKVEPEVVEAQPPPTKRSRSLPFPESDPLSFSPPPTTTTRSSSQNDIPPLDSPFESPSLTQPVDSSDFLAELGLAFPPNTPSKSNSLDSSFDLTSSASFYDLFSSFEEEDQPSFLSHDSASPLSRPFESLDSQDNSLLFS
ncbi:hypothetical protein JCM5350_004704 [Sporobolomyces pararoseus]